jgi:pilus assembly protein Flp/PilA
MKELLNKLAADKSGASAAEYALIIAVIAGLLIVGLGTFGGNLNTALTTTGTKIQGAAPK